MTADEFKKINSPRAHDLGTMFEYFQADTSAYSMENTKRLDDRVMDFDAFMQANSSHLKKLLECKSHGKSTQKELASNGF